MVVVVGALIHIIEKKTQKTCVNVCNRAVCGSHIPCSPPQFSRPLPGWLGIARVHHRAGGGRGGGALLAVLHRCGQDAAGKKQTNKLHRCGQDAAGDPPPQKKTSISRVGNSPPRVCISFHFIERLRKKGSYHPCAAHASPHTHTRAHTHTKRGESQAPVFFCFTFSHAQAGASSSCIVVAVLGSRRERRVF